MPKEVVVALIAVSGVIFTQVLTYAISRQGANDLRTNISRDIDIIRKLWPGSEEATKLEDHVRASIDDLIARDERRARTSTTLWILGPLWLVSSALYALEVWRDSGVPEVLRWPVDVIYWVLFVNALLLIGLVVWSFYQTVRLWIAQVRSKRRYEKAKREFRIMRAYDRETRAYHNEVMEEAMEALTARKDELIEEHGQQWWDESMKKWEEMMKEREELDRQGAALEKDLEADGADDGKPQT